MNLRPYQFRDVEECFRLWDSGQRGTLTRLATGLGKTRGSIAKMQRWLARGPNQRCMVLIHEIQLADYWAEQIQQHLGITPGVEMAEQRAGNEPVVIASRATLLCRNGQSRLHKFDSTLNWLVFYDECDRYAHKQTSTGHIVDWFDQNPHSKRSGITATPNRFDKVSILDRMFPAVATDIPMPIAINEGWSVPIRQAYVVVRGVTLDGLPSAQDSRDELLSRYLLHKAAEYVTPTLDLAGQRRTIMFSPSVEVAHAVAAFANRKGTPRAVAVDGTVHTDKRKAIYAAYQRGEFQFLSCCGLCTRGFDDPGTSCVAVFRSFSKDAGALAEQIKGRGSRVLPGVIDGLESGEERRSAIAASQKQDNLIIDVCGDSGIGQSHSTLDILCNGLPDAVVSRVIQFLNGRGELINQAVARAMREHRPAWYGELATHLQELVDAVVARAEYFVLPETPPWKRPGAANFRMYMIRLGKHGHRMKPEELFAYVPMKQWSRAWM